MCGFNAPSVGGNFSALRFLHLNSPNLNFLTVVHLLLFAYTIHIKVSSTFDMLFKSKPSSPN